MTVPTLEITELIMDNYSYVETSELRTSALQKSESESNLCGYVAGFEAIRIMTHDFTLWKMLGEKKNLNNSI